MAHENPKPYRFGLVLAQGFSHLAMAAAVEPLFIANWIAGRQIFGWSTLSTDGFAATASNGMQTAVDYPLGTTEHFDVVLVLASFEARKAAADTRLLNWLRWAERAGSEVGAIETGSEILAAAGMLNDHTAPAHWYNIEGMRERYPEVDVTDTLYSLARKRPVSAGASATLDMMVGLIARTAGQALASEVALHLLLRRRPPDERQQTLDRGHKPPAANDPVARAHQIMAAAIDEPKSCSEIARMVGVSERHLQRLFQQEVGSSVVQAYHSLRMERAHQLVQQTDLSITEVAVAAGFSSLEVFSRTYRKTFGVSPSRDRRQSVDSSVFRRTKP
jgi:AraC family carnitine catabolism transcriptional activator